MDKKNRWEDLFEEFLHIVGFSLVKYPDGWGLIDKEGGNIGDIESDRFDNALMILDRMDIYTDAYFASGIENALGIHTGEYVNWADLINIAKDKMTAKDLEEYRSDLDILDMICNHPKEVNLDNCDFDIREE